MEIGDLVKWIYINDEDEALLAQGKPTLAYGHIGIVTHNRPDQFVIFWAMDNESSAYMKDDNSLGMCLEVL
tara:strand:- start:618 stop:830 length:213 start_codon:yes stop_codon:yes gene_type:complete